MNALMQKATEAISVTDVSREARDIFEKLRSGQRDWFVVRKNSTPIAVILSVRAFAALFDEIDDLRMESVARRRLHLLGRTQTIGHRAMTCRFAQ
jgi:antitoxin StbD